MRFHAAVASAYGWPANLTSEDVLARLLGRNRSAPVRP
jgi:hypothetical protein